MLNYIYVGLGAAITEKIFEDANCDGLITIEKAEVIKYITQKS